MARVTCDRLEQITLIVVAIGGFIAAFLFYPDRQGTNPSGPGWLQVLIWILFGTAARLIYLSSRHTPKNRGFGHNSQPKDLKKKIEANRI